MLAKDLRTKSMQLFQLKYKSSMPTAIAFMTCLFLLNSTWGGQPIATLPFSANSLLKMVTQRGLDSSALPDNACSLPFFYMACSLALKENVSRFLGNGIPRGVENPILVSAKEMEGKISERLGLKTD